MSYIEDFNKVIATAKALDLSLSIELKQGGFLSIWVYSYKYRAGKHIALEQLIDIENINFKEIATENNVRRSIEDLVALGYSKEEIEERFVNAIHGAPKEKALVS